MNGMAHIIHVNICHIQSKLFTITQYIHEQHPDIILFNETHYNPDQPSVKIPGYSTIARHDNDDGSGGTAIMAKSDLVFTPIDTSSLHTDCCAIQTSLPHIGDIAIVSHYIRPYHNVRIQDAFFSFFTNRYDLCLFMGDYNAKHQALAPTNRANQRGLDLYNIISHRNLNILNNFNEPTRIDPAGGIAATLDLALTTPNLTSHVSDCYVGEDIGSDHLPLHVKFKNHSKPLYPTHWIRNLKKADWKVFQKSILDELSRIPRTPLSSESVVDDLIEKIHTALTNSLDSACPLTKARPNSFSVSPATLQLIRDKRKARRLLQRDPTSPILRNTFNNLKNRVRYAIADEKRAKWRDICGTLDYRNGASFWKLFKQLSGASKGSSQPRILNDGNLTRTDRETATTFASHLAKVHQIHTDPILNHGLREEIDDIIDSNPFIFTPQFDIPTEECDDHPILAPITEKDFIETLKKSKNSAPGEDKLGYAVLKHLPLPVIEYLTFIFNALRDSGYFPKLWKSALGVMIPKPNKDPQIAGNYRPISLLRCLGKLFEKLLSKPLINHLLDNKLINPWQRAFLPGMEANEHVYRFANLIQVANHYGWKGGAIFLDVEKAFDSVWQNALKYKLTTMNLPNKYIRILSSFLDNRTIAVRVKDTISSTVNLSAGTPQGSVLSPILFNIYVNDVEFPDNVRVSQYADDLAIWTIARSTKSSDRIIQSRLSTAMQHLELWCRNWHIKINATKSQLFFFPSAPYTNDNPFKKVSLFGQPIPLITTPVLLGMTFNTKLTFNQHCKAKKEKALLRINLLKRVRGSTWGADIPTLLHLYKTFIRPILETGYVATATASARAQRQLQVAECKALRAALKVMYTPGESRVTNARLYELAQIEPIQDRLQFLKNKALVRYQDSPLIQELKNDIQEIISLPYPMSVAKPPCPYL